MNELTIKLTGTVNSSNFDEWKKDLINQIQSKNIELVTDDDFASAERQVKQFKFSEKTLKLAKQSAIEQADEIQRLFAAIDDITEEARQARLSLERQIKSRKLEIKNQFIQSGIEEIQGVIDQQIQEFKSCDLELFLSRSRFESAVSRSKGTKGLQNAVNNLCEIIKGEIARKAIELSNNKGKLNSLPEKYKLLFQDGASLLKLSENQLDVEIDKRISRYNEQHERDKVKKLESQLAKIEQIETLELNVEKTAASEVKNIPKDMYRIIIDLFSTKENAIEIARSIKSSLSSEPSISEIKLTRHRDD